MALTVIVLDSSNDVGSLLISDWGKGKVVHDVGTLLDGLGLGGNTGSIQVAPAAVYATGTITISGGSGAVGGIINGTTVTATWATSDANSAGLVAAAINANTTVNKWVTATAASNVVTVQAGVPGAIGNCITLALSGTGVTVSGAKLGTGGAAVLGTGAPALNSVAC